MDYVIGLSLLRRRASARIVLYRLGIGEKASRSAELDKVKFVSYRIGGSSNSGLAGAGGRRSRGRFSQRVHPAGRRVLDFLCSRAWASYRRFPKGFKANETAWICARMELSGVSASGLGFAGFVRRSAAAGNSIWLFVFGAFADDN